MSRPFVHLAGLGVHVPARVVTNHDFEARLETSDQWIVERTGIRERRFAEPGVTVSTMAQDATGQALSRAGLTAEELDAIIVATATPDRIIPSTACYLQAQIGARRAAAFDISAACSGFLYGLTVAEGLVCAGQARHVLVVGGEKLTGITDQQDRSTAILFGDGAGAAVVSAGSKDGRGILSTFIKSDGNLASLLYIPGGGTAEPISEKVLRERSHYMKMAGREVFKHAVLTMAEACDEAIRRAGVTPEEIDLLVPHQANIRIIDATAEKLGLDPAKVIKNIHKYGNTTAGTIPLAICDAIDDGRLKKGDLVLFTAVGAGFTAGSVLVRWAF